MFDGGGGGAVILCCLMPLAIFLLVIAVEIFDKRWMP
jgi:hypothetical protein